MFQMHIRYIPRLALIACYVVFTLAFIHVNAPVVRAAAIGTITITPNVGAVGTKVTISGTAFERDGTIRLYTTTDQDKCAGKNNPDALGLKAFTQPEAQVVNGQFTVDAEWPATLNNPDTPYYICGVGPGGNGSKTLSSGTFTVINPTIDSVEPKTIQPGGQVTVKGSKFPPDQKLNVFIAADDGTNQIGVAQDITSDANGNFTAQISIIASAQAQNYSVFVTSASNANLQVKNPNAVTVTGGTATPTTSPTASATTATTPITTPTTPTPTTGTGGENAGPPALLLIVLGGLGALFVVLGIILFFVYSRIR